MNAPIANVKVGSIAMFDCSRYHNASGAMTKVRPVLVLAVAGERAIIVPLSTKPNFTPGEPCCELTFSLRAGLRSFAKVMLMEGVPLTWLRAYFDRNLQAFTVPQVPNEDLNAVRRLIATLALEARAA